MKTSSLFVAGAHAAITGGSRGIGLAVAEQLAALGARVSILAREPARLTAAAQLLNSRFPNSTSAESVDVGDAQSVVKAFSHITERHGQVQILINNAGVGESCPFHKSDLALWQRMIDINLTGTYLCSQAVIASMLQAGQGRVINVASTAGLRGFKYVAAYCAAKHGVVGLTRALAVEYEGRGVTFNAVCPGYTKTDLLEQSIDNAAKKSGRTKSDIEHELKGTMPEKRFVEPKEVAEVIVRLCSTESSSVNGEAIVIDGSHPLPAT